MHPLPLRSPVTSKIRYETSEQNWVRMKMIFKHIFLSVSTLATFLYTITTLLSFIHFLSNQNTEKMKEVQRNKSTVRSLFENLFYCYFFFFQHSFMATKLVKKLFVKISLGVIQRLIYVTCSSLSLNLLITKWQTVDYGALWLLDTTSDYNILWYLFTIIQILGWSIVFGGCIMMDWGEMFGLKQAYYSFRDLGDPMSYKSRELQSLYNHMRHPSLVGFIIIFWIHPHMTLDRFLLAFTFIAYMFGFYTINDIDYKYQHEQLMIKRESIKLL